jgi:hypothetical protein
LEGGEKMSERYIVLAGPTTPRPCKFLLADGAEVVVDPEGRATVDVKYLPEVQRAGFSVVGPV